MFSKYVNDFVMSFLGRQLQCGFAVIDFRLYISTMFEQQAHDLQRAIERGPVQRGHADLILRI
jgi:hypothetical protein